MNKRILSFTLFTTLCLMVGMILMEAMKHTSILPEYRKAIGYFQVFICSITLGFCIGFIMSDFSLEKKWVNIIFNVLRNSFVVLEVLFFSFAILFACGVPFAILYTYYPYVSIGAIIPFVGMEFVDNNLKDNFKVKCRQLFIGKPTMFYVKLFIDLAMFVLYSHITYKVNMAIYKYSKSAWPYWIDFIFAALLIDRMYRIYGNFKQYYDAGSNDNLVLVKKRKELIKMRKSLEASINLVQRLKEDKVKYQEKIEATLQENPDAEDAKIDVFLSEIDRLDSRIAIGESTREKFESKVNILIGECNALERMPEPEPEPEIEPEAEEIELPDNDEAEGYLNHYNQELVNLRRQHEEILEILGRVRGNIPDNNPTLQRAENLLLRIEDQIRATQRHANYYHQIRVANNMEYFNRVLRQETMRVVEGDREETEDNEQEYPLRDDVEIGDLISTDGYPICPHCQREHNYEGGHEHTPYCSQDCKYLDNTCGICLKPLTEENNHGGYCSFECVTESHNRASNGD